MIGISSKRHQYWQSINAALVGFALGLLLYEPVYGGALLIASAISGTLEARFDKREVNWRV